MSLPQLSIFLLNTAMLCYCTFEVDEVLVVVEVAGLEVVLNEDSIREVASNNGACRLR